MNKKEYSKAYYEANKDEIAVRKKAYRKANPDKIAASGKAYRESNKEKEAARHKAYYEANKDELAARMKDYNKAYYEANKEAENARSKAYHKNAQDESWEEIYKHLGTKCSCPTCRYDSKLGLEVDHIIPVKQGPHKDAPKTGVRLRRYIIKNNCWDDFQLLCGSCNKLKHWNGGVCNCGEGRPNQPNSTALWLGSIQASDLAMAFLIANRPKNEPTIEDLCHPDQSPY